LMQRVLFASNFTDGLLLSALAFMTGGAQSIGYWLLLGLIARNAISWPLAVPQLVLNVSCSLCYIVASLIAVLFSRSVSDFEEAGDFPLETFLLRILVLWLVTGWCYVLQVLLEKQRRAAEEAQEYAMRQEQLRSAGKLAGKIAHQIKNPLGIINNAAYSLARALREGKTINPQQVEIIREEVERADQTITQLMGYAKLAEGKVEKIDAAEELERALDLSVPAAARYPIEIERDCAPDLPPLFMQRSHLHEALVNLLTNAREAIVGKGRIRVSARLSPDQAIIIAIADDGPGISKTKLAEIFQPYYTTKVKGTGLGLPIVKHNIEMYGGTIQVESELGKGTRFILQLPTRTITKQTI
jgi:signal transduction histidine kinase